MADGICGASNQLCNNMANSWGWKEYNNVAQRRSCPGNPPRERRVVLDMPYLSLTNEQRGAAKTVLGVHDQEAWELATPRRLQGDCAWVVLSFQAVHWDCLSKEQQADAAKYLGLSKKIWNDKLSPFHDDLWSVGAGVSMTKKEFATVLSALKKICRQKANLSKADLISFLLGTERVLSPMQAVEIIRALKASHAWQSLREQFDQRFSTHVLVASFLSDMVRFLETLCLQQIMVVWNDDACGCTWGNTRVMPALSPMLFYASHLKLRRDNCVASRRCVAGMFSGILVAQGNPPLPKIPMSLVMSIMNEWVGRDESVDPSTVCWPVCYGQTLADFIQRKSTTTS